MFVGESGPRPGDAEDTGQLHSGESTLEVFNF